MNQIVLYPDTTGVTQTHDQINQRLHSEYEAEKARLYSPLASLNCESFMKILGNIWKKWLTVESLTMAAKRVGIAETGLNVNWMDQSKFKLPFSQTKAEANESPRNTGA